MYFNICILFFFFLWEIIETCKVRKWAKGIFRSGPEKIKFQNFTDFVITTVQEVGRWTLHGIYLFFFLLSSVDILILLLVNYFCFLPFFFRLSSIDMLIPLLISRILFFFFYIVLFSYFVFRSFWLWYFCISFCITPYFV